MKTSKIAIITELYGNRNCGGLLQAFALQKFVENSGYSCEQLLINDGGAVKKRTRVLDLMRLSWKESLGLIRDKIHCYINPVYAARKRSVENSIHNRRKAAAEEFIERIGHSEVIYSPETIDQANARYDLFICGSDQIWNPHWVAEPMFALFYLGFVEEGKKKISYAASMGVQKLTREYERKIKLLINRLDAVSVREESACGLLQPLTDQLVTAVLDPVMLLTIKEWCAYTGARVSDEEYIFCYLLGREQRKRSITDKIAKKYNKRIKALPHAAGRYCLFDEQFADVEYEALSPDQFVREIASASYIVTDSFHCAVFSILMNKQFVVLKRNEDSGIGSTNSRLSDLLHMFGLQDRIVADEAEAVAILALPIDYGRIGNELEKRRADSIAWLLHGLSCEKGRKVTK